MIISKHYIRDNLLAKSLNENCYERNPAFLNIIQEHNLLFKPYSEFKKADLDERQALYQKLCEGIWNPDLLRQELENNETVSSI